MKVFPGALQTEQKIGSWREAFENEMNLKHSEGYHKTVGSNYLVGSSAAPYCNSKYPTHLVVVDARTQHRLIDQLFSVAKCVRLSRLSENPYELLTKMNMEGQLDVIEYSCIHVPESVHMGDPAGGYVEMVKATKSARGDLMAWHDQQAMQELLEGFDDGLKPKEKRIWHCDVIGSESNSFGTSKLHFLEAGPREIFR